MEQRTPINESVKLDKYKYIMSRTDTKGNIEFGNDYFFEISGYTPNELIGKSHNMIRHPDMPKVIFKLMWERLKQGKTFLPWSKTWPKTVDTTGSRQSSRSKKIRWTTPYAVIWLIDRLPNRRPSKRSASFIRSFLILKKAAVSRHRKNTFPVTWSRNARHMMSLSMNSSETTVHSRSFSRQWQRCSAAGR